MRLKINIFQRKQQNAVPNECRLMSMPMSLQRNSFRRKENLHMGKPWLCTHCIHCIYRHFQQHKGEVQGNFHGEVKMRRKLARIHLCRHFQQQASYLYVYYKFSPCFWGPASHHWPSPHRKGKEDMGRKKKDQDSEANKVIIISFFLTNHILITSYSSGFK